MTNGVSPANLNSDAVWRLPRCDPDRTQAVGAVIRSPGWRVVCLGDDVQADDAAERAD